MYSYILDILLVVVLSYYVFGEQFLYGNSVFPYCFKKLNLSLNLKFLLLALSFSLFLFVRYCDFGASRA